MNLELTCEEDSRDLKQDLRVGVERSCLEYMEASPEERDGIIDGITDWIYDDLLFEFMGYSRYEGARELAKEMQEFLAEKGLDLDED